MLGPRWLCIVLTLPQMSSPSHYILVLVGLKPLPGHHLLYYLGIILLSRECYKDGHFTRFPNPLTAIIPAFTTQPRRWWQDMEHLLKNTGTSHSFVFSSSCGKCVWAGGGRSQMHLSLYAHLLQHNFVPPSIRRGWSPWAWAWLCDLLWPREH